MAKRKRIGLIFSNNKRWMGGTYYILNLISTLNKLPSSEKPIITLLCASVDDYKYAKEYTNYQFLNYIVVPKLNFFKRLINKFSNKILKKTLFDLDEFNPDVDVIYPVLSARQFNTKVPQIAWIADLQHKFLPQYFSQQEIIQRNNKIKQIIESDLHIVFSSEDARNSFHSLYNCDKDKTHVYNFTAFLPQIALNEETTLNKYNVKAGEFLFCANQFWAHKNHLLLFKAIKLLRDEGINVKLICSGNNVDYRNTDYYPSLLKYINDYHLNDNIQLVGLIDRQEQLILLNKCKAVIQPSLFEGWSTSVEEAKALNKVIIVSDIPLHREQVKYNCLFFDKDSEFELANCIKKIYLKAIQKQTVNYENNKLIVAQKFMNIINSLD